jgi:hypothetical protein
MDAEPKRKRRCFQFRLRTLFLIVAIAAVQCGVCLPMLREWQALPDTWRDAGGTGSIGPFSFTIHDYFGGKLVNRKPRALRRFANPHASLPDNPTVTPADRGHE